MHCETENRDAESGGWQALQGASWREVCKALRNYWGTRRSVVRKGFRKGVEISIEIEFEGQTADL